MDNRQDKTQDLFNELKYCWEFKPSYRCLQLPFSMLPVEDIELKEFIDDIESFLKYNMHDYSTKIFVCEDKDVFIVSRQLTYRKVNEFFALQTPQLLPAQISGLAKLFEIGVDWPRLRRICEKKLEALNLPIPEPVFEKEKLKSVSLAETLKEIDPEFVKTLGKRRQTRKAIEIMVVEDDSFSRTLINRALGENHHVSLCPDGQAGVLNYVTKAPDILFLDIGLPDIDGHKVLEAIYKMDPDAYVVMLSGAGDKENITKAIQKGAKGFIGKPFSQEKLHQYIAKSPFVQTKTKERSEEMSIH